MARLGNPHHRLFLEVAAITRQLKRLARDLQVPVITLAQLNRAVEQRGDKTAARASHAAQAVVCR